MNFKGDISSIKQRLDKYIRTNIVRTDIVEVDADLYVKHNGLMVNMKNQNIGTVLDFIEGLCKNKMFQHVTTDFSFMVLKHGGNKKAFKSYWKEQENKKLSKKQLVRKVTAKGKACI
jgi:hypothetical protein